MRKVLLVFLTMLISSFSFAQTRSEHLKFKGIPIDGSLSEFVTKMKAARYTYLGTEEGIALFEGEFAGYKGCTIGVVSFKSTNVVYTIGVIFPEHNDWSSLESNYDFLKTMLIKKYGESSECVEKFQTYTQPQSDNEKIIGLETNECTYYTTFETSTGSIQLSLEHEDVTSCFVKLQYWDKINTEAVKGKAMDDL